MEVDEQLQHTIEQTLLNDPRLSANPIAVTIRDGEVTLTGTVQSYRRQLLALQVAAIHAGHYAVRNQLHVDSAGPVEDATLAKHVREAFSGSSEVSAETIEVSATGGKVTLRGTVGSAWEYAVADDLARAARGVRDVICLLLINPHAKVADKELANSILAALSRITELSVSQIGVAVAQTTVSLFGRVVDERSRSMAESTVRRFGLLHIRNDLQIEDPESSCAVSF